MSTNTQNKAPMSTEPVVAPEGWKLVPIEPTDAMLLAGHSDVNNTEIWWSLMLDAAPAALVSTPAPAFSVGVRGVGIIDDNPSALAVYFNAAPSDDDIRALHEIVSGTPVSAPMRAKPVALPKCPFHCGWDGLHKIAVQDAAFLAKMQWPEDEESVSVPRATVMRSMDCLIQVCRAMLNAAPVAATLSNIEAFVACDASAISYLSLGEYRTALLKMLRQAPATKEPGA